MYVANDLEPRSLLGSSNVFILKRSMFLFCCVARGLKPYRNDGDMMRGCSKVEEEEVDSQRAKGSGSCLGRTREKEGEEIRN